MSENEENSLGELPRDIENGLRNIDEIYELDANERLFLYLKWMYDTKYITTDDFKNIVEKYKEKKCLIKWKCEHEELLKEIGEKSNVYVWFHRKTADMLRRRDNIYIYSIIILNTITSMFTLIGTSYDEYIDPKLIALISGGVNLSTGLITAIYKKINMGGTVDSHLFALNMFTRLSHSISSQLAISPEEREPMPKYLKDKLSEYENLILESPVIPEHIIKTFLKFFDNLPVNIPNEISGGINNINVFTRQNEEDISEIISEASNKLRRGKRIAESKNWLNKEDNLETLDTLFKKLDKRSNLNSNNNQVNINNSILMKVKDTDEELESSIIIQKYIRGYLARKNTGIIYNNYN